jgi:hypothetical protein
VGACIHALKFALELGFFDICLEGPRVNSVEVGHHFRKSLLQICGMRKFGCLSKGFIILLCPRVLLSLTMLL